MEDLLIKKNLGWTGHLLRMPTDRLLRQVLYSQRYQKDNDHMVAHVSAKKTKSREI